MLKVKQIYTKSNLRNFSYLLYNSTQAICIDPYDSKQIEANLRGKELVGIINTHEHYDHYCGNEGLLKYSPKVYAHEKLSKVIPGFNVGVKHGDEIFLKNSHYKLEVIETPGHTEFHIGLLLKNQGCVEAVFSGDTMFNAGVGNCHNGGDPGTLFHTIWDTYRNLGDSVKLYPGHDYLRNNLHFTLSVEESNNIAKELLDSGPETESGEFSTDIGQEKQINCFLRLNNSELIAKLPGDDEKERFIELRKKRDKW